MIIIDISIIIFIISTIYTNLFIDLKEPVPGYYATSFLIR